MSFHFTHLVCVEMRWDLRPQWTMGIPMHVKIINLATVLVFILLQIFIMVRLDQYTLWNWFVVFIPWFLYEGNPSLLINQKKKKIP